MLKSAAMMLSALGLFCMPLGVANAQNPVEEALMGCSKELNAYCSAVTPGGGRLVSCAKAHEDKLSSECMYSINRAGYWLDTHLVRCQTSPTTGASQHIFYATTN